MKPVLRQKAPEASLWHASWDQDHALWHAPRTGIGNGTQAQRTGKDAATGAVVLAELEKAAYQGRGWPRAPGGPQGCAPWDRASLCLMMKPPQPSYALSRTPHFTS